MRNWWADEFEQAHRTPACLHGAHGNCPHLWGFGGGLNPRRLRLEFGAGLCKCDCHSACPITCKRMTVSGQAWRDSCTCPGAEAERGRRDQAGGELPDFSELWASSRQRSQSRREAFQVARASAAGKTREEVTAMYIAELQSRGLEIPHKEVLDAVVDAITGNYVTSLRLVGRSVAELGRLLGIFGEHGRQRRWP